MFIIKASWVFKEYKESEHSEDTEHTDVIDVTDVYFVTVKKTKNSLLLHKLGIIAILFL